MRSARAACSASRRSLPGACGFWNPTACFWGRAAIWWHANRGGRGQIQHFRLDRITSARLEAQSFRRDPDFSLDDHAASAFGSFHDAEEFAETIWRFSAAAAPVAREFIFHPRQELTENDDGSLTVRFAASGHLEMAWHLYAWGDQVEVLAPERLRGMVMAHRRGDFPALP